MSVFLVFFLFFSFTRAVISDNVLDWLVKSVCVDSTGNVLNNDPYFGCPSSSTLRKLVVGDPLPYNNFEQMGYQICDSFVLLNSNGNNLYVHTFDYEPFNIFNQYSGSDGYDVYSINSNTVSVSNTKDGGGYGSTFYGSGCSYGNGWALFPTADFLTPGQGYWPISGVYWEHNEISSPGPCPSSYSTNTLASWEQVKSFSFSGVNGNPVKSIDALVSYHGFETEKDGYTPTDNFLANGHLEVFYYTELYGLTRWEVWFPTGSKQRQLQSTTSASRGNVTARSAAECSGTGTGVYKGVSFVITDCHDWSNVKPVTSSGLSKKVASGLEGGQVATGTGFIPQWPVVNANLLQHAHFEASGLSETYKVGLWGRFGSTPTGNLLNWSALISTGGGDANDGSGMAYLAFNCGAGSDNQCGTAGSQAVFQDIAVDSRVCGDCVYLFGANLRAAPGTGSGTVQIALQLLNTSSYSLNKTDVELAATAVLWQQVFTATIQEDNGDGRGSEAQSVYLSSKFVSDIAVLPPDILDANTAGLVLRYLLLPVTANTFHVSDAFCNRFPQQTSNLVL